MCGIFAVTDHKDSAQLAHVGLFSLQHRGQESAGIAVDGERNGRLSAYVGMGLVSAVFSDDTLKRLPGASAVGHVRYSTSGGSQLKNAQPFLFEYRHGQVAVAHNGNITNSAKLRAELEKRGAIFQSSADTEIIVHLMARCSGPLEAALVKSLPRLCGAYSFIFMAPGKLIGVRDPLGFRPLSLGKLGKSYLLSSETAALESVGAKVLREIEPGELVIIEKGKLRSLFPFKPAARKAVCIFEHIYFARPDSMMQGRSVQSYRYDIGRQLAREMKGVEADMVVPVPDSGNHAAFGFARESGIPAKMALMRNHYMGRSFINFTQSMRDFTVKLKLSPIRDLVAGKKIILVDDSIVRGTTSQKVVARMKEAGVRKIYMAIASPPVVSPCYYGIDTPTKKELIANKLDVEGIRKFLGVDSLNYISREGLIAAACRGGKNVFCTACFTGKYPVKNPDFD